MDQGGEEAGDAGEVEVEEEAARGHVPDVGKGGRRKLTPAT